MITTTPLPSFASTSEERRIGLSLAGGGFRAAFFHIGVLARLAELDLLRQIDVLSCVSGGSIIGSLYYLYLKRELDAHGDLDTPRLIEIIGEMEQHFLNVVQKNLIWRSQTSLLGNFRLLRGSETTTERIGDLLDRDLFQPIFGGDATHPIEMRSLNIHPRGQRDFNAVTDNAGRHCKVPALLINAAVLNSGQNWRFDVERMGVPPRAAAARQVEKNWLLCQSRYNGLHHDYAATRLGQAVAASVAIPGLAEPLLMRRLYPHPDRANTQLQVNLVDGELHDKLGLDALRERRCTHVLVSDASSRLANLGEPRRGTSHAITRSRDILAERVRTLQLSRLADRQPHTSVLMHMMREMEAPELKPIGPADNGHIIRDRSDSDITSYGVDRHVQTLLTMVRNDLDAFSDTEAMALMAYGYLVAKQSFADLEQHATAWTQGPAHEPNGWRFAPVFDLLKSPTPLLLKRLHHARFRRFKGLRLVPKLRFEAALLIFALLFCLYTLATILSMNHHLITATNVAIIELVIILGLLAYPAFQRLKSAVDRTTGSTWLETPLRLIQDVVAAVTAPCLWIAAGLHLYTGRHFLKSGRLAALERERSAPSKTAEPAFKVEAKRRRIAKRAA